MTTGTNLAFILGLLDILRYSTYFNGIILPTCKQIMGEENMETREPADIKETH